ncbi:MAG: alpha/beta fold hydrolase, partial [Umezawaea sp.]
EIDLTTDSWAELDSGEIRQRMTELTARAGSEEVTTAWLPFRHKILTGSGRSAETSLCTNWPGKRGVVPHNGLFPTLTAALVTAGFQPVAAGRGSGGDIDLDGLADVLQKQDVAFICVELSSNAGGGQPVSPANLKAVRRMADDHDLKIVLDATRIVENAVFVAGDRDVWEVVRELLSFADTATLSLTKDFAVTSGGLLATDDEELAQAFHATHRAVGGRDLPLTGRKIAATALADTRQVEALVRRRMAAAKALWVALHESGAPVVGPAGGHCVLLENQDPEQVLARTGIRVAPHLGDTDRLRRCVRLAVPVGVTTADAADRLVRAFGDDKPVADNENLAVLKEHCPSVERYQLSNGESGTEVFVAGDGPPVLFMPPFNVGAGMFARQFAGLADHRRVICVHHPGIGASAGAEDITLDGIARLAHTALDQLGVVGPVHLAGASFGGLTALAYALAYPEGCASLTLIGSSYRIGNRVGQLDRLEVVVREDFDHVLTAPGTTRVAERRSEIERILLRCESMDPKTGLRYLDVFAGRPNLGERLEDVNVPTLVVQGSHDSVIPMKTAHLLHGAIPDSRYVELPGAGHFPCLTHADEVNELILEFTKDRTSAGAVR